MQGLDYFTGIQGFLGIAEDLSQCTGLPVFRYGLFATASMVACMTKALLVQFRFFGLGRERPIGEAKLASCAEIFGGMWGSLTLELIASLQMWQLLSQVYQGQRNPASSFPGLRMW